MDLAKARLLALDGRKVHFEVFSLPHLSSPIKYENIEYDENYPTL